LKIGGGVNEIKLQKNMRLSQLLTLAKILIKTVFVVFLLFIFMYQDIMWRKIKWVC